MLVRKHTSTLHKHFLDDLVCAGDGVETNPSQILHLHELVSFPGQPCSTKFHTLDLFFFPLQPVAH